MGAPSDGGSSEPSFDVARATTIDELLRGEIAAAEAYHIALRRIDDPRQRRQLSGMLKEHGEAIKQLARDARSVGGDPATGSGAFGLFARVGQWTAGLLGRRTALLALRAGELRGLRLYLSAASQRALPAAVRERVRDVLVPQQNEHVRRLDAMVAAS